METLHQFISNYYLFVALFSWAAAQVLKTIINLVVTKKFHAERLFGAGGMPSAHTALVVSLSIAIARKMGVSSPEFAIAFLFAAVVMYDAMGVRRASGEHAKVLNQIIFDFQELEGVEFDDLADLNGDGQINEHDKLKESLGHTPLEVLGGALLGILVVMILPVR